MLCSHCGCDTPDESVYCAHCGACLVQNEQGKADFELDVMSGDGGGSGSGDDGRDDGGGSGSGDDGRDDGAAGEGDVGGADAGDSGGDVAVAGEGDGSDAGSCGDDDDCEPPIEFAPIDLEGAAELEEVPVITQSEDDPWLVDPPMVPDELALGRVPVAVVAVIATLFGAAIVLLGCVILLHVLGL